MTQEEFDKAPLLDQILYDETGILVENHPSIAEAMEEYHQAKLKLLGIGDVSNRRKLFDKFYEWLDGLSQAEYDDMSLTDKCENFFFKT